MRVILQRVKNSSVKVAGVTVGSIGRGMMLLVGIEKNDSYREVIAMADKLTGLRIFEDDQGKMNLDIGQVGGEILVVSQFTLAGSVKKGRRPSFDRAAHPSKAEPLVEALVATLKDRGLTVAAGRFGAHMEVELVNDGPVTFVLDAHDGQVS